MNREDIIRMALAAGIYHEYDSEGQWDGLTNEVLVGKDWLSSKEHKLDRIVEILSPFAALVAAAAVRETSAEYRMGWNDGQINEREACVAIAEKQRYALNICLTSYPSQNGTAVEIANAIRARGQA